MFGPGEKELVGDILLQVCGCLQIFQLSLFNLAELFLLQNSYVNMLKLSPVITCILQVFYSSFC